MDMLTDIFGVKAFVLLHCLITLTELLNVAKISFRVRNKSMNATEHCRISVRNSSVAAPILNEGYTDTTRDSSHCHTVN